MKYRRTYLMGKPKPSRRKRRLKLYIFLLMMLVLAAVYAVNLISTVNSFHNQESWAQELRGHIAGNEIVYLVYGLDFWGASPYVERVLLLHHNTATDFFNLLYIPGHTMVEVSPGEVAPLGQVYRQVGNPGFINIVKQLTGLPVHHYLAVNYQGILDLSDHLDGIAVEDLAAAAPVNLLQVDKDVLQGLELYKFFLMMDYSETPEQQLERQRQVLLLLWDKMDKKHFWQWPRLFRLLAPHVETDLSWRELRDLRDKLCEVPFSRVKLIRLPGTEEVHDGCLYWVTSRETVEEVVCMINEGYLVSPPDVSVEVLNGSGVPGQATKVSESLQNEGFNVIRTGNADRYDYEHTMVIALGEAVDKARAVALFIPNSNLFHRPEPGAQADVRVIVGLDYVQ